ncbi:hypothetical protein B5M47_02905 [candidate division CPR3 bacterium 4484_211]|uniref:Alpha/beta hydrolase n=1 Tax=candidate division CPR3 bacterium 4484_211 TaxID=1968527 RepID=A0A1W9NXL5_UNCC3|nr:MAG: hypothetical protein B5M47_02905 [candidate division CPR3 bacterium 4484_211]
MKNVLILHGTGNNSQGNWFPWLKKELERRGYKVWVPDLPDADYPNTKKYLKHIFSNWQFDEDSIVVGHSSGAVAILGFLQNLPENVVIKKAILVSAFKDNLSWDALNGLFEEPFNWEKIKAHAKRVVLYHSDNDPYVPLSHAQYLKEKLDAELLVKKGQGHFNLEVGPQYKQFPELLEKILED